MVMGPGKKNGSAGEGQQQFTRTELNHTYHLSAWRSLIILTWTNFITSVVPFVSAQNFTDHCMSFR
jgi:hypothetical protein